MLLRVWSRVLGRPRADDDSVDGGREDPALVVSRFFQEYSSGAGRDGLQLLDRARTVVRAVAAARTLPVLTAELSGSHPGAIIRQGLAHHERRTAKTGFLHTALHEVAAVLILPTLPGRYAEGSAKQTVRRKSRAAERAGVRWARVDDISERLRLIALSETRERHHPQEQYRSQDVDNSGLLHLSLWLVACTSEGQPLLMTAVPIDGEWAMLSYFCTLQDSPEASDARYLMSRVLAEQLVERGVRYLVNTATMSNLPAGLRHFQHMLGYRVVRIRVARNLRAPERGPDASPSPLPPDAEQRREFDRPGWRPVGTPPG